MADGTSESRQVPKWSNPVAGGGGGERRVTKKPVKCKKLKSHVNDKPKSTTIKE